MKRRADQLLVEKGLCESRAVAQRLILAGEVRVGDDGVVRKTSDLLDPAADLRVVAAYPYVSRGAEKLLAALRAFEPDLHGAVALDIGASTGGFTEVLLERGARRVYAVDVGYGQLHARLRADPRVVCLEKVNSRYLSAAQVPDPIVSSVFNRFNFSVSLAEMDESTKQIVGIDGSGPKDVPYLKNGTQVLHQRREKTSYHQHSAPDTATLQ